MSMPYTAYFYYRLIKDFARRRYAGGRRFLSPRGHDLGAQQRWSPEPDARRHICMNALPSRLMMMPAPLRRHYRIFYDFARRFRTTSHNAHYTTFITTSPACAIAARPTRGQTSRFRLELGQILGVTISTPRPSALPFSYTAESATRATHGLLADGHNIPATIGWARHIGDDGGMMLIIPSQFLDAGHQLLLSE